MLLPADDLLDPLGLRPRLDHLAADFRADLGDDAQDVAQGRVGLRPADEVRRRQREEVGDVAVDVMRLVVHVAKLVGQRRQFPAEAAVDGFRAGQMVAGGADAADPGDDARQLFDRPADDEPLETAQLGNLEVAILHAPVVVEEDLDLAVPFQARDGVDADRSGHQRILLCNSDPAIPKR